MMGKIMFLVKSALDDFKRNRVRTFLTSLGILIGVLSVVLLIAFGIGLRNYIQQQFDNLGSNIIYVFPGQVLSEDGGFGGGNGALGERFTDSDVFKLKKLDGVLYVVPILQKSSIAQANGEKKSTSIVMTNQEISNVLNLEAQAGRLLTKADVDRRAKEVMIGPKLAEDLYGSPESAVGKKIRISDQSFKIKGVLNSKGGGGLGGPSFDSFTYVSSKINSLNPNKKYSAIYVTAVNKESIPTVKNELKKQLLKKYKEDEFQVVEQTEILNIVTQIFSILNYILIAIGSISLIVGGIGIMNIMYATVTERTKEVGDGGGGVGGGHEAPPPTGQYRNVPPVVGSRRT
jgi:putative ABC transport system permease protein